MPLWFPLISVWFIFGLLSIFALIFWLWMLIDCLSRKKFEDKLVWVIVLLFLNIIGAILYYFLVKSKD
ncbi:MAG: PLDc N-terminal domain-containing protein [Candidatus Aenigmatarchaeota archaeon]